jgi:hypothetical protein
LLESIGRVNQRPLTGTEHFYVAAPAVVAKKARPGFEQWWADATAPALMF